jgi:hypothetical protein
VAVPTMKDKEGNVTAWRQVPRTHPHPSAPFLPIRSLR